MAFTIPRPVLIGLILAFGALLYAPVYSGDPIWDDYSFWFTDRVHTHAFSFVTIWKDFAWPFSVSVQKLLFQLFAFKFFWYHAVNVSLHLVNAYILYVLAEKFQLKHRLLFMFLFLIHPVAVISVGWMIQLKTVLCMTMALLALLAWLRSSGDRRWLGLSYLFYGLSVLAKSSSLPLPLVLALYSWKARPKKEWVTLVGFFLIMALGTSRILGSKVTQEGMKRSLPSVEVKKVVVVPSASPAPSVKKSQRRKVPVPVPTPQAVVKAPEVFLGKPPVFEASTWEIFLHTFSYYFWQPLVPIHTAPVKGFDHEGTSVPEVLQIFYVMLLLYLTRKGPAFYLVSGLLLLLPYFGILRGPYMNVTWVSDQHLYLALPFFLLFWMTLVERLPRKLAIAGFLCFSLFFSVKTYQTATYYQDEVSFFEPSLSANPFNVPVAYNLALTYAIHGYFPQSRQVIDETKDFAQFEPRLQGDPYFKEILKLDQKMRDGGQ